MKVNPKSAWSKWVRLSDFSKRCGKRQVFTEDRVVVLVLEKRFKFRVSANDLFSRFAHGEYANDTMDPARQQLSARA